MKWEELRKEAYSLSVYDRLLLIDAIVQSLSHELRPRPSRPQGIVERLSGVLKTDGPPPTDEEVEKMKEEYLEEKYLK